MVELDFLKDGQASCGFEKGVFCVCGFLFLLWLSFCFLFCFVFLNSLLGCSWLIFCSGCEKMIGLGWVILAD